MLTRVFLVALLVVAVQPRHARPDDEQNSVEGELPRSENIPNGVSSYLGGLRQIGKIYNECSNTDFSSCLKLKLLGAMERLDRSLKEVPLTDGVSFVKDPKEPQEEPAKSLAQIEASLPRSLNEKDDALNGLILNKILNFFKTHSLNIKFPSASDIQGAVGEEARFRRRRNGMMFMIPMMIAGTLVPIALGGLALFAGKALLVSKLALVLASIIGLKKLLGGQDHEKTQEIYITAGHGHGYGYEGGHSRSYKKDPHTMVYSGYVTK